MRAGRIAAACNGRQHRASLSASVLKLSETGDARRPVLHVRHLRRITAAMQDAQPVGTWELAPKPEVAGSTTGS